MDTIANTHDRSVSFELHFIRTTLEGAAAFLISARSAAAPDRKKLCDDAEKAIRLTMETLPRIRTNDEERRDIEATIAQLLLSHQELCLAA